MATIRYMPVKEFRREGYLQELNRQFLHPLGLALEVIVEDDGSETLGGIWDYRSDPEGIRYAEIDLAPLARRVQENWAAREPDRAPTDHTPTIAPQASSRQCRGTQA